MYQQLGGIQKSGLTQVNPHLLTIVDNHCEQDVNIIMQKNLT